MKRLRILSGGQTGVDQAALKAAIDLGIAHGGWCPPGRSCDEGLIPSIFHLEETPEERSSDAMDIARSLRTKWNVRDADASLVLFQSEMPTDPGTQWTMTVAKNLKKPLLLCNLASAEVHMIIIEWMLQYAISKLNVAGPSERESPGIGAQTYKLVTRVLSDSKLLHVRQGS